MYREEKTEMKELLQSLVNINESPRSKVFPIEFESHIIFDGAIHNNEMSEFALTLLSLLKEKLGIELKDINSSDAPFGKKLTCKMKKERELGLNIYLKDNTKVKNKKRWSQVMYMSHILEFLTEGKINEAPYILATDADVRFTAESVKSLLRLLIRDSSVGAACGRTIPTGSGYIVWYQKFEYAVGHWFQKTAEHVLGSVMCAPGCFSMYQGNALRKILPQYCTNVEKAFDFLTKDMGEDRWMCTLLLKAGFKIEYCAASENQTFCPDNFEELYKQRRRWMASTVANMILILKEWSELRKNTLHLNFIYFIYQGLQLFATLIAPSMIILIVSGGLHFAWSTNETSCSVLQVFFITVFAVICFFATSKFQLMIAKLYAVVYAVIMCAVIVGTIEQLVKDIRDQYDDDDDTVFSVFNITYYLRTTKRPDHHISADIPVSATTMYLAIMVGMYLIGGFLHPRDIPIIVHGLWYLLCLPSSFLILPIYSICNLTDSSWGTREEHSPLKFTKLNEWKYFLNWLYNTIFCCCSHRQKERAHVEVQKINKEVMTDLEKNDIPQIFPKVQCHQQVNAENLYDIRAPRKRRQNGYFVLPVEEWLPEDIYTLYAKNFEENGFENTLFIKGIAEHDLKSLKICKEGHVFFILDMAKKLPNLDELDSKMPENVNDWLDDIGLSMYKISPGENEIESQDLLGILKDFNSNAMQEILKIKKLGHVKRLLYAITRIQMSERNKSLIQLVEEWLPDMKTSQEENEKILKDNGFENTLLIKGISKDDLKKCYIPEIEHEAILQKASEISDFDLDYKTSENVIDWLEKIGLSEYKNNLDNIKTERKDIMETLKMYGEEEIKEKLKITKFGHVKRLLYAIRKIGKEDCIQPVEDWLPKGICSQYTSVFRSHGFENTLMIKGITEGDLVTIGIRKKKHVDTILAKAVKLPPLNLDNGIPKNVNDWLDKIGLSMYRTNFIYNKIESEDSMVMLKGYDSKAIQEELKITKHGHVKRLLFAITKIGNPTEDQTKISDVRNNVKKMPITNMDDDEYSKWTSLVDKTLKTPPKEFGNHDQINAKLLTLRNQWLTIFLISNTMWLISISTIANKWILTVIGENPFGLLFVLIFGVLLSIQFLAMLVHRMRTICHYMVRQPLEKCNPLPCCFVWVDEKKTPDNQDSGEGSSSNDDTEINDVLLE